MSGLSDVLDNVPGIPGYESGSFTDFAAPGFNIDAWSNMVGGSQGSEMQGFLDPLDLMGERAQQATDEINRILEESAASGIALNEAQLAKIEELTAPFREASTGTALPNLSAFAMGGDVDYQPSQLFEAQLEQGRDGTLTEQAGGGAGIKSSNTFEKLSDLVSRLASEDVSRFETGQAALVNQGITAEQNLKNSGTMLSGNISDILTNLGTGTQASANSLAQQQVQSGQTAGAALSSIGTLIEANQGGQ